MRPPGPNRKRYRRVLLLITLLAVTFVTIDATGGGAFDPVRNLASDVTDPASGALGWVTSPFRNTWAGVTGYEDLENENQALREELDEIKGNDILETNAQEQLSRLNDQLNIRFTEGVETEVARAASGPRNNFEDNRMGIDKGTDSGLEVGMPVVTKAGLIGRLERVSAASSVVQLITDPEFVIGVRVGDTQHVGIGHGSGWSKPFIVERVEVNTDIEPGNVVLTSGFSRSIMPALLPVGTITEIVTDSASNTLILKVALSAELERLDVVQVMKWTPPE